MERHFQAILVKNPKDFQALHGCGVLALQRGDIAGAIDYLARAVARNRRSAEAQSALGAALHAARRYEAACAAFRAASRLAPKVAQIHAGLASVLHDAGQFPDAIAAFRQAIKLSPNDAGLHYNLGIVLRDAGLMDEAIASYQKTITLVPGFFQAFNNLGNLLWRFARHEEAVAALLQAIHLSPGFAPAHVNLANALHSLDRDDEAMAACREAIRLQPGHAQAYNTLGALLRDNGDLPSAAKAFYQAINFNPGYSEAHYNLGTTLSNLGQSQGAISSLHEAARLNPSSAETQCQLGVLLQNMGMLDDAAQAFERAMTLATDNPDTLAHLVYFRHQSCDWREIQALGTRLVSMVQQGKTIPPFRLLSVSDDPAVLARCARQARRSKPRQALPPIAPRSEARPIRIGYLSADFRNHAVGFLTAELFERHDRNRFTVFGYSCGPDDGSSCRARIRAGVDSFIDIQGLSDLAAAEAIRADDIDILVDLTGHTNLSRTQILAYRPAPVQVNWLGYPGTLGENFVDYILADRVVIPQEHQEFFSEKVVYLPHTYQVTDSTRAVPETNLTKFDVGLPENGFVFCSFNNTFKFNPGVFKIWMRLLSGVPGSVLWLLDTGEATKRNLRHAAGELGINPGRLVFAPHVEPGLHLARHRLADLFLDTLPYNAHTTASDALWAGLPVVTCMGQSFAGRVAASLLKAVSLDELVTSSSEDYEALALRLAQAPEVLAQVREGLAANRHVAPLFNTAAFARHIEIAYEIMMRRWRDGLAPEAFAVHAAPCGV